jgi:hypothetical protein
MSQFGYQTEYTSPIQGNIFGGGQGARPIGVRSNQSGFLYNNPFSMNVMEGNFLMPQRSQAESNFYQDIFDRTFDDRQSVADQTNQMRDDMLGQIGGQMGEVSDLLGGIARGEGLTDLDAGMNQGLGFIDEGMAQGRRDLERGRSGALSAIDEGMGEAVAHLESARHGAMAATAINAGRQAGEQAVTMASQMAAAGASPGQIVGAQIQADASRGQQAAAIVSQTAAQYDSAISQVHQNKAQLKASTETTFAQSFAQMEMQGAGMKANMVQSYDNMRMSQDNLRMQASVALGNAYATGNQQMINVMTALPPSVVDIMGLTGELFSLASIFGEGAALQGLQIPGGN